MSDAWSPRSYEKFGAERQEPFADLLAGLTPRPGIKVLDLGCGTGRLTRQLHLQLGARETLGVERSAAMFAACSLLRAEGLRFERAAIESWSAAEPYDLIFSNAALHWVEDHPALLQRLTGALASGGQLAVQVPDNSRHPSQQIALEVALEEPFRTLLGGWTRQSPVLTTSGYEDVLQGLSLRARVEQRIYVHMLESTRSLVDWMRGTTLTVYRERLGTDAFAEFLGRYETRLMEALGDQKPYPFEFTRILFWAEAVELH